MVNSFNIITKENLEREIQMHYKQCTLAVQIENWDLAKKHAESAKEKRAKLNSIVKK